MTGVDTGELRRLAASPRAGGKSTALIMAADEIDSLRADNDRISAAWADVIQREQQGDNAHFFDMEEVQAQLERQAATIAAVRDLHKAWGEDPAPEETQHGYWRDLGAVLARQELEQPPEHSMIPGSHERPGGPECRCGAPWDRWNDRCSTTLSVSGDAHTGQETTEHEYHCQTSSSTIVFRHDGPRDGCPVCGEEG